MIMVDGGKWIKTSSGIAVAEACCCDCPCGDSPPAVCAHLVGSITNKSGSAECLPSAVLLEWDGSNWVGTTTLMGDPCQANNPPCPTQYEHDCSGGNILWIFRCSPDGYELDISCSGPGQIGVTPVGSQQCQPFVVSFDVVLTSNQDCVYFFEPPPSSQPIRVGAFRMTITNGAGC